MDYCVLDLETANADCASICQVGIVTVREGLVVSQDEILVDPEDYFDEFNIDLHGITPEAVATAPTFSELYADLVSKFGGGAVLHHGPFDRGAINRACEKYSLPTISAQWLDTQRVVRRTWAEFTREGYALGKLAQHFGITYRAHNALADALTTNTIFCRAVQESGHSLADWLGAAMTRHALGQVGRSFVGAGAEDAPHAGETIVFTGTLEVPRAEAAALAKEIGFSVEDVVGKRTTVLCAGIQSRDKLAGYDKSSKHRKAEALIGKGQTLQIISERDFWALIPDHRRPVPKLAPTTHGRPVSPEHLVKMRRVLEATLSKAEVDRVLSIYEK